ncbi:hypothetical protein POV27_00680 [Aureisphaera galaxeae]|uniref:hypothetical protein n=1 Tax=Aureisphaera galaxeae TaxID=1538023 RepID=UPI00235049F3|nr:hypothetical protein [Aureisphaera galaxeae]MDC8002551.1 hypothetical protein [Aureisphaera galaxeae]
MKSLYFVFMLTILMSCLNDDDNLSQNPIDQLPPETQIGADTFGFSVNGEAINVTNTSQQTALYGGGILQLGGGIDNSEMDIGVIIRVEGPLSLNTNYDLTNTPTNNAIFVNNGEGCYYDFPETIEGFLRLTRFDQTNFIVSGTFEFSNVTDNCEDVVITNGRFDMHYTP